MPADKLARSAAELDLWDRLMGSYRTPYVVARTAAALVVLGGLIGAASSSDSMASGGSSTVAVRASDDLHLFNGLDAEVIVHVDKMEARLSPGAHRKLLLSAGSHHLYAKTSGGAAIEEFDVQVPSNGPAHVYKVAGAGLLVNYEVSYGAGEPAAPVFQAKRWVDSSANHIFEAPPQSIRSAYGSGERRWVLEAHGALSPSNMAGLLSEAELKSAALAHARHDSSDSRYLTHWLHAASGMPEWASILAARLAVNPVEVVSLRVEQDIATPESWSAVADRHRAIAARFPENADLRYIAIRAMRGDDTAQDLAFIEAYRACPDNLWLANAAAYAYARFSRYEESLSAYARVLSRTSPLTDSAAMEAARVRRWVAPGGLVALQDLISKSSALEKCLELENGPVSPEAPLSVRAIRSMYAGDYDGALRYARQDGHEESLLPLVAASDGASDALIGRALGLSPDKMSSECRLCCAALSMRRGLSSDAWWSGVDFRSQAERRAFLDLVKLIRPGMGFADFETRISSLNLRDRGRLFAYASVALGESAPAAWRRHAKTLLFAPERSRFR